MYCLYKYCLKVQVHVIIYSDPFKKSIKDLKTTVEVYEWAQNSRKNKECEPVFDLDESSLCFDILESPPTVTTVITKIQSPCFIGHVSFHPSCRPSTFSLISFICQQHGHKCFNCFRLIKPLGFQFQKHCCWTAKWISSHSRSVRIMLCCFLSCSLLSALGPHQAQWLKHEASSA